MISFRVVWFVQRQAQLSVTEAIHVFTISRPPEVKSIDQAPAIP